MGQLPPGLSRLLSDANLGQPLQIVPLEGGANNRVFRVTTAAGNAILKVYFCHPSDPRDRRKTEFSFCQFLWNRGIGLVPKPLATCEAEGASLFEEVAGCPLSSGKIDDRAIRLAADFFLKLNSLRREREAEALPLGSEACFSLAEHLNRTEERLARLKAATTETSVRDFIDSEVSPQWDQLRRVTLERAQQLGWDGFAPLPKESRRLSPSDFGFHNALLEETGSIRFLDLEYAGWDDPARTICDFFCQPEVPVPLVYWDLFCQAILEDFPDRDFHQGRATLLLPIYRMKWITMRLNEFLPVGENRRKFSQPQIEAATRKATQLAKARKAFSALKAGFTG